MNIHCIIVDDEALARKGLQKYVDKIDFLILKGICKNAMEANTILNREKIDLVFLDIEMPMLSGLDFLRTLQHTPKIIFTTAYSEYALESYEFDVADYLVKPISFERFLQAANKVHRHLTKTVPTTATENIAEQTDDHLFIKTDSQLVKVLIQDILFVESMQNYIRIHTTQEALMTLVPLKRMLEILSEHEFMQVHKSFVIAKNKVDAIIGNQLVIGNHKIPIGRSLRDKVLSTLVKDKVLKK